MIRTLFAFLLSLVITLPVFAQEKPAELKTDQAKLNYLIGIKVGGSLKAQGIDLDMDALGAGIRDALNGIPVRFSEDEQHQIIQRFQAEKTRQAAIDALGDDAWKIQLKKPEMMTFDKDKRYYWVLLTNMGTIKIELMPDVAPMHVTSTIYLTEKGFYDGLTFHRIIPGFMAQGGDPLGNGMGGPGYQYEGEFSPKVTHNEAYMVSMANAGAGTDGSQFFITFAPATHLDGKHTIFGRVVEGKDVVRKIETYGSSDGTPKETVIIERASIQVE